MEKSAFFLKKISEKIGFFKRKISLKNRRKNK